MAQCGSRSVSLVAPLLQSGKKSRERLTLIRIFEELRGRRHDGGYDAVRPLCRANSARRGGAPARLSRDTFLAGKQPSLRKHVDDRRQLLFIEYRALPSRRTHIPKADGKQRPLAIAALEDKIVQRATVAVLNAIYEEDFLGFSTGSDLGVARTMRWMPSLLGSRARR